MGASAVLEGFASAGERQHFGDHRLQLPLIHELRDLIQLSSIPANDETMPRTPCCSATPAGTGDTSVTSTPPLRFDAIVVGARCAGSPTAMLLARKGYRVLVVDRATFPSDTISTHIESRSVTAT